MRRATTGSAAAPPATHAGAVDLDAGEPLAQHDGEPVEAGVGDEEVRALAHDEHGDAGSRRRRRARPEHGDVGDLEEQGGGTAHAVGGALTDGRVEVQRGSEPVPGTARPREPSASSPP